MLICVLLAKSDSICALFFSNAFLSSSAAPKSALENPFDKSSGQIH